MTVHQFHPTVYYNALGSHPPAMRVADGDTVETTTVDARGYDSARQQVAAPGNPMTGPFYIEGAEPGDTLVVALERIAPNRSYGWSSTLVAANVVDPWFVPELPWPPRGERRLGEWHVEGGTARLTAPESPLGAIALPTAPMLGCFGVAPAGGQAISTATSGEHGGNMDYRGFVSGVTVYLPVLVPGALLHLGDGHALQGDGEVAGTGVEISMDVRFTVRVQKGRRIGWPRGESAEWIFTVGNARPLDQCVQHATTEMLRWLQGEYHLDPVTANTLVGQCVAYDLGNMFDPAYTMVCKLPKAILRALGVGA